MRQSIVMRQISTKFSGHTGIQYAASGVGWAGLMGVN
jgi:hypothetical protein